MDGRDFQFTRRDMSNAKNWLPARRVLAVVASARAGSPGIDAVLASAPDGNLTLPGDLLLWLAEQPVRKWGLSTHAPNKQWIDGPTFARLYRQASGRP